MDARVEAATRAYFGSFNSGDDEAHTGLLREGGEYFGTGTGVVAGDPITARRVLKASREVLGIQRLEPLQVFGEWPRFAVRTRIHGNRGAAHVAEAVFVFIGGEDGRLDKVWALWNPAPFLAHRA